MNYRELAEWPGKETKNRFRSTFKASWFKTEELLARELRKVSAVNVELKTFHSMGQRRKVDRGPLSDRRPNHPGVVLTFQRKTWDVEAQQTIVEEMQFPCDTFDLWEDNMRAIALTLEALRLIDRFGVKSGSQYAGFKALPPAANGGMTPEQAARFIIDNSVGGVVEPRQVLDSLGLAEMLYKQAQKKLHPDAGGNTEDFQKLEESMRLLRELKGGEN